MQPASPQPETAILSLGDSFYDPVRPATFPEHLLRFANRRWAERIGLGGLDEARWIDRFGRFEPLPGSLPEPLALRYHGHQFRTYNPEIGDGRGFLYAQLRDQQDGRLLDLGTKGSGQTPYSRFGDGRLTLKGGVREVLATEMLEALGVSTSKSFSLIETGEALERNDEPSPTRAVVLVRLSHSHIRYGTFQRLAFHEERDAMARLVDYCLVQLLGGTADGPLEDRVARFLDVAVGNAARLVAGYMAAGFVHGVLNTDNINVTGESFDYGPYRFTPRLDPNFTAAYFDHQGLYSYGRQPEALHWNLYQLAKALLLIVDRAVLVAALETFPARFEAAMTAAVCARLGVAPAADHAENIATLTAIDVALAETGLPPDRFYFDWRGGVLSRDRAAASPAAATYALPAFRPALDRLCALVPTVTLDHVYWAEPAPCSLLIDEIEALWAAIDRADDWAPFHAKIDAIRRMGEALDNHAEIRAW